MTEKTEGLMPCPEKFKEALSEAMQLAWNDWCADTGCFPDDFEWKGGNGFLTFGAGKWSNNVAGLDWMGFRKENI